MNDHEIERIAAAMHAARPDWPASSVATLIRKKLGDRPRRDVFVALAWVASEPNSATPARVLENGPWWRAAAAEGERFIPAHMRTPPCIHCGYERHECERRWKTDHAFESPEDWMRRRPKQATDVTRTVEAIKAEIQPACALMAPATTTPADVRADDEEVTA